MILSTLTSKQARGFNIPEIAGSAHGQAGLGFVNDVEQNRHQHYIVMPGTKAARWVMRRLPIRQAFVSHSG